MRTIDLEPHYTKVEKAKRNKLNREMKRLQDKSEMLMNKYNECQKKHSELYRKVSDLGYKVMHRVQKNCKHANVVGPYECMRDDCSGGHYRCINCNKSEFHDFRNDKK